MGYWMDTSDGNEPPPYKWVQVRGKITAMSAHVIAVGYYSDWDKLWKVFRFDPTYKRPPDEILTELVDEWREIET